MIITHLSQFWITLDGFEYFFMVELRILGYLQIKSGEYELLLVSFSIKSIL